MTHVTNFIKVFFTLTVVITTYQSIAESCYAHKFVKTEGMELPNQVIKTVEMSFVELCWDECAWLPRCLSVNARKIWDALFECDLNSANTTKEVLVSKQGSDYYEMTEPDEEICQLYSCKKPQDINECARAVCPANSICVNKPGSYSCDCNPGFAKVGNVCIQIYAKYEIIVYTATSWGAGTNSKITATITGKHLIDHEKSYTLVLKGSFENGDVDKTDSTFININPITKLEIHTKGDGWHDGWDLAKIEIKNDAEKTTTTFSCNCEFMPRDFKTLPPT